jgi:hypothetical protein
MSKKTPFETAAAHRYFATDCFIKAWDLIDKSERTPEEDQQMIGLGQASLWHWSQREDCTGRNLSVGYWQASRIYALVGQADEARRYGSLSLDFGRRGELPPFFIGYSYEALARAESVAGTPPEMEGHLEKAREAATQVSGGEKKTQLLDDIATIE